MNLIVNYKFLCLDQLFFNLPTAGFIALHQEIGSYSRFSKEESNLLHQIAGRSVQVIAALSALPALIYGIAKCLLLTLAVIFTFTLVKPLNSYLIFSLCLSVGPLAFIFSNVILINLKQIGEVVENVFKAVNNAVYINSNSNMRTPPPSPNSPASPIDQTFEDI